MKKQLFLLMLLPAFLNGEIKFEDKYSLPITLQGYVAHESYWDSRQVTGPAQNEILIYPDPVKYDMFCNDVNNRGQFSCVPVQSRIQLKIDGPDINRATSCGIIETDFVGRRTLDDILTMRHAYLLLKWDHVRILAGQYWHPLFSLDSEVRTISFNTGLPIECFSRNPQVRLKYNYKQFCCVFTALSELIFTSDGPIGMSSTYMRNAVIPNLNIRPEVEFGDHVMGCSLDYKRIVPRLETDTGFKAHESLNSVSAIAYTALKWENFEINNKIIFAQNGTDQSMIGGYAVHSIDPVTDNRTYTNINTISCWTDWAFRPHKPLRFGFFMGFIKNLGSFKTIEPDVVDADCNVIERRVYGGGTDINTLFRFAPRLSWIIENFELSTEVEYTRAAFGYLDDKAQVHNTTPTANTRLLVALYYYI